MPCSGRKMSPRASSVVHSTESATSLCSPVIQIFRRIHQTHFFKGKTVFYNVQRNANAKFLSMWFFYSPCNRISKYKSSLGVLYDTKKKKKKKKKKRGGGGGGRDICVFIEKQILVIIIIIIILNQRHSDN